MTPETRRMPVLYVEDEENDVFLLRLVFKRAGIGHPLEVVPDGKQAVEYLCGTGRFADPERHCWPCLVMLDLNLPGMSGMEVLEWLRGQAAAKDLPVVIFTSSEQRRDKERARELGANEYIVKPSDLDHLKAIVKGLEERWMNR